MPKSLLLLLVTFLYSFQADAQTYYQVTNLSGTASTGGINVTVTATGGATNQGSLCGSDGPYWIGYVMPGSYKFDFSSPASFIRIHMGAINLTDTVQVKINGTVYSLTSSNTVTNSTCVSPGSVTLINGMIEGTSGSTLPLAAQIDIVPGFGVNNVEVLQTNGGSGVVFDMYIASGACPGHLSINHDSACIGLPMHITTSNAGLSANASYSWTGPNSFSSASANPTTPNLVSQSAGRYVLTVNDTGCIYKDSIVITPHDATTTITTNAPLCEGNSLHLNTNPINNASYQWTGPNNYTSSQANPIINNIPNTGSGKYFVNVSVSGCQASDSVNVTIKPKPAPPIAGNNGPVCTGSTLMLTATDITSGVSYDWTGPGSYTSVLQNPQITNCQASNAGTYTVHATLNGCTDSASTSVVVEPASNNPSATITSSNGTSLCPDSTTTFAVTTVNAVSPSYQWRKNGADVPGATSTIYTPLSVSDGDTYSCFVTSNSTCQAVASTLSNFITLHVGAIPMPGVSISVFPSTFTPGITLTFTAAVSSSNNLSFQWRKNGIDIPGATASTYASNTLSAGDIISLFVKSSLACTVPDTLITNMINVDVNQIKRLSSDLTIYPNPNNGNFTIRGKAIEDLTIEIFNDLGQLLDQRITKPDHGMISENIKMKSTIPGLYMLQISTASGSQTIPFIVNK